MVSCRFIFVLIGSGVPGDAARRVLGRSRGEEEGGSLREARMRLGYGAAGLQSPGPPELCAMAGLFPGRLDVR